jgi:hypothetical protein
MGGKTGIDSALGFGYEISTMARFQFYTREFLESLPDDDTEAIVALLDPYLAYLSNTNVNTRTITQAADVSAVCHAFFAARGLPAKIPSAITHGTVQFDVAIRALYTQAVDTLEKRKHEASKDDYLSIFKKQPVYVFADADFEQVQVLMNELRDLISHSELIPPDHKRRLLKRLEAMQSELHKKSSDIDRFWGFIAEAGIVARKFGEDLNPITERVDKLGRIVISVIMATEGIKALPSIVKLLGN